MSEHSRDLLEAVEEFLRSTATAPSRLGRDIMRDPSFVEELRAGRGVRATTALKIRTYLAEKLDHIGKTEKM